MKYFQVHITLSAHTALKNILDYQLTFNYEFALSFYSVFFQETEKLNCLPHRWINLNKKYKAILYKSHFLVYSVNNKTSEVHVIDIIDHRQYSHTKKYY
jgi:hypothetical protein